MHAEAMQWCREHADGRTGVGLDIGGRDINGSARALWPNITWTVLDVEPGPGVDVVADAATWVPDRQFDVILCTEVLEHAAEWRAILRTAYRAAARGGLLVLTAAGPGRAVHSGLDGGPTLHPGEHYANVTPTDLRVALAAAGWPRMGVFQLGEDVRATAQRWEWS